MERGLGARWVLAALVALPVLLTTSLPDAAGASPVRLDTDDPAPTRILLVGDSITQGVKDGYSYRYFLWHQITSATDMVGNKTGPAVSLAPSAQDPAHYADPDFDYHHAGVASAEICKPSAVEGQLTISTLAYRYQPDIIVAAWGINDLRRGTGPEGLISCYDRWIRAARVRAPDADLVIARLPWAFTVPTAGARFNALLPELAKRYSTSRSRIVLAQMAEPFSRSDTYDDLHPNADGERKIATMFASALGELGVGVDAPPLMPDNTFRPVTRPESTSLVAARQRANVWVRWNARNRATAYTVRCNGVDRTYHDGRTSTTIRSTVATACRVRASNYAGSSPWSKPVRVEARGR